MHDRGLAAGRRIACRVPDFRIVKTAPGDSLLRWPRYAGLRRACPGTSSRRTAEASRRAAGRWRTWPFGSEMLDNIAPLWLWAGKTVQRFQDRRAAFDGREILRGKK